MTRRERDERARAIVAAKRRGVSTAKLATDYGITRQAVNAIVKRYRDEPSIPTAGIVVDAGDEVRTMIEAFDQAIEDLGDIVTSEAPVHVKLGAITRALDARERRLRLMASAGWINRNLAAPLIEQEMAAMVAAVVDVMRENDVGEDVIRQLLDTLERRSRGAARREALAA